MIDTAIAPILAHLDERNPGGVLGVYLYGSATTGGPHPDSDIDLLVITERSLTIDERTDLVAVLLATSGRKGHRDTFPDIADRRPIELTSVVVPDDRVLKAHTLRDFQYGEWLREELLAGELPAPVKDHDLPILLATAQTSHHQLRGQPLADLVDPVTPELVRDAMVASLPDILAEIIGDERNTILVFARMLVTLDTGRIVAKDVAADAIIPTLAPTDRPLVALARDAYRGDAVDDWTDLGEQVVTLVHALANRISQHASADNPR